MSIFEEHRDAYYQELVWGAIQDSIEEYERIQMEGFMNDLKKWERNWRTVLSQFLFKLSKKVAIPRPKMP